MNAPFRITPDIEDRLGRAMKERALRDGQTPGLPGSERAKTGEYYRERRVKIANMYHRGMTPKEIGEHFDLSSQAVCNILLRMRRAQQ